MSSEDLLRSPLIAAIDAALAHARDSGPAAAAERLARARDIALAGRRCGELSEPAAAVWRAWQLARARHGGG